MELGSLRMFVKAAELGSFSKAAASLGIKQPTISRVIAELEEELAGELFHRTGRGVSLTEKGEMLFPKVRSLLQTADEICAGSIAFEDAPVGNVAIAAFPSLMRSVATALYSFVRDHAPGIRLRVLEGFSDQIERWIAEGRADIGLLSKYRTFRPGHDDVLLRTALLLVRSRRTPATDDPIDFRTLANLPLVLPSPPNGLRLLLEEMARKHKVTLNIVIEADSLAAQRQIVRECGCYSIMAAQALKDPESSNELVGSAITGAEFVRYVTIVTSQQHPMTKASRVVLQQIRRIVIEDAA